MSYSCICSLNKGWSWGDSAIWKSIFLYFHCLRHLHQPQPRHKSCSSIFDFSEKGSGLFVWLNGLFSVVHRCVGSGLHTRGELLPHELTHILYEYALPVKEIVWVFQPRGCVSLPHPTKMPIFSDFFCLFESESFSFLLCLENEEFFERFSNK